MIATFDHIALQSNDIAGSIAFYQSMFPELLVHFQDETWAIVTFADLKVAFVKPDQHPQHIALRVRSRPELTEESTKSASTIKKHRDDSESFYVKDPFGNAIEIVYYP
ncbi:MAG: VOC family protein [Candidatus Kapaibacterium sp.]|jgi:catechol-2,3-dioxygenase